MRGVGRFMAVVLLIFLSAAAARAEKRVALVIGNSRYETVAQLPNPANDARAFAKLLNDAGFDSVTLQTDLGIDAFRQSLRDFTARAADADIAVFYYAGHGLEVDGANLLVPVDAKLRTDLDAEDETVSVDRVLRALKQTRKLRLVVLDACRDNPFVRTMKHVDASRSVSRGFQRMDDAPSDTMIAFATEPGSVAIDGDGRDSPFTQALLNDVTIPGLDLRIALGKVRDDVLKATDGHQRPYVTGSLGGGQQSLVPGAAPNTTKDQPVQQPPTVADTDTAAGDFKFAEGVASVAGWQMFLRLHPRGPLADLATDRLAALQKTPDADGPPKQQQAEAEPQAEQNPVAQTQPSRDLAGPAPAFIVGNLDPNGDNFLALRTAPSASAAIIERLLPGTGLAVDRRIGFWVHVAATDGNSGWVSGNYVVRSQGANVADDTPAPSENYSFVTGLDPQGDNFLALKAAPSIRATRIMKMGPGTKLLVTGRRGDWAQVRLPGGPSGWAAAQYIGCCTSGR